ncbi:hypothetical protein ROA7450_00560 [Roseovarius albus]|uniref:Outer membrane protein beta-barrel domain-containing protein n=1 Tax=Roseovarius albus TaxID=1247867 RepID=A0A1X6YDN5_9RHOB|nr:porin family protein [Roseovarius albus]SLN17834.1 hypothetical protein ROA7450_00560 [Roseovarius albus]
MTRLLSFSALVAASLTAAPAVAGDWTGGYVGGQFGFGTFDSNISSDDTSFIGGIIAGYDYDFGEWVVGAGIDLDFTDATLPDSAGGSLETKSLLRLKVRGGYDFGDGLLYATGGYAHLYGDVNSTIGNSGSADDGGYFIGAGYEHLVSGQVSVAGEILYHSFDDYTRNGVDVDATTYQLRVAYRF